MLPIDSSYVGIGVSIAGNILISVSLNTQKLAHKRQSEAHNRSSKREASKSKIDGNASSNAAHNEHTPLLSRHRPTRSSSTRSKLHIYGVEPVTKSRNTDASQASTRPQDAAELDTLRVTTGELPHPAHLIRDLAENGAQVAVKDSETGRIRQKWLSIRGKPDNKDRVLQQQKEIERNGNTPALQRDPALRERGRDGMLRRSSKMSTSSVRDKKSRASSKTVYASKIWWLGICLMALGELGNFTSYAFAPASVVAPLGTVALIANCFIAPLMLHEKFRKKDILAIGLSIIGAVTIVLSSKSENKFLTPKQFIHAVSQTAFVVYSFVTLGLIVVLLGLSRTKAGDKYLAIDLGICALCGGFTVLSTKAFSSFLTQGVIDCFKQWPTYPVLAVLIITAVMQIIYLNVALQHFESRVVVPTQFVTFTISAITGSAILYRDFEDVVAGRVAAFFIGCSFVFVGVVILTRARDSSADEHAGDASGSTDAYEVEANDSQISGVSLDSRGRLLEGVTLSSHPPSLTTPATSTTAANSPLGGRALRKYKSISGLPTATYKSLAANAAVATSIRSARPPSLASAKLFSPGYLLIAGSGFRHLESSDSDEGDRDGDDLYRDLDEDNEDLEAGGLHSRNWRTNMGGDDRLETLADEPHEHAEASGSYSPDDENYEPLTRSALMKRSGTV